MERQYHAITFQPVGEGAGFRRPIQPQPARVTLESPALEVMTDLARTSPATIRPLAPIDAANQFMIARGVRLLLVVDERETVLGVVTSTDVLGEKAMRIAMDRGMKRGELTVADIMTGTGLLEALAYSDVAAARVGHVLETLRKAGRQHVLVVDFDLVPPQRLLEREVQRVMVRGILSLSQLARQLGVPLQSVGEVASSFSEIGSALSR